jgi:hypothetical protein
MPSPGFAEDGGGVLAGGDGLVEPARLARGVAEVGQRAAFAEPIAEAASSGQADGSGGQPVVEPAPPVQVLAKVQGEVLVTAAGEPRGQRRQLRQDLGARSSVGSRNLAFD